MSGEIITLSEESLRRLKRELDEQKREMANLRRHLAHVATRHRESVWMPGGQLRVKNQYSETFPQYSVIQITGPDTTGISTPASWGNSSTLTGSLYTFPNVYDHYTAWGVTLEEIPPDGIGAVAVDGVCPVRLNDVITPDYHYKAVIPVDGSMHAQLSERGPASVIFQTGNAGSRWALVNLNNPDIWHGAVACVSNSGATTGANDMPVVFTGTSIIDASQTALYGVGGQQGFLPVNKTSVSAASRTRPIWFDYPFTADGLTTKSWQSEIAGIRAASGLSDDGDINDGVYLHIEAQWTIRYKDNYLLTTSTSDGLQWFDCYFIELDDTYTHVANRGQYMRLAYSDYIVSVGGISSPYNTGTVQVNDLYETKQVRIVYSGLVPSGHTIVPVLRRTNGTLDFRMMNSYMKATEMRPDNRNQDIGANWEIVT
jgi:hypothetical protein